LLRRRRRRRRRRRAHAASSELVRLARGGRAPGRQQGRRRRGPWAARLGGAGRRRGGHARARGRRARAAARQQRRARARFQRLQAVQARAQRRRARAGGGVRGRLRAHLVHQRLPPQASMFAAPRAGRRERAVGSELGPVWRWAQWSVP